MRPASAAVLAASVALSLVIGVREPARGHTTATGIAVVTAQGVEVRYRLTVVLAELPMSAAPDLAAASEGDAAAVERVVATLRQKVHVKVDDAPCRPGRALLSGSRLGDTRLALEIEFHCPRAPGQLAIRDDWFDLFGEHYRTLARIDGPSGVREVAFLPDAREASIDLGRASLTPQGGFFWLGLEHILTGYDHLLFLLCLVVPLRGWRQVVSVISVFTVAHSFTLLGSAFHLAPSGSWFPPFVETAIAASIVYMALENIVGVELERRVLITALFGLVHGFGFSYGLSENFQFAGTHLLVSLFAFNVGIELGQLLVLALMLPALALLRRHVLRGRVGIIILSALVAHTAWHWMTDRAEALWRAPWPHPDLLDLSVLALWLGLLVLAGGGLGVLLKRFGMAAQHGPRAIESTAIGTGSKRP